MENVTKKLSSRKLWLALAGVVVGVATILGVDAGDVSTVAGAIISVVSVVTYIVTEGRIDAAAVGDAAGKVQDAIDAVAGADDKPEESEKPPENAAAALAAVTSARKSKGVKL